ncbi:DUF4229 domain-containing protein [Natronosporangium hydrolyticum]|uniref:DUF4229 domain-containing protein n=1 Tax=Natronosporangium hydrolyticum TaxID=2811111 RepID=A0A895YIA0_9ACTN|nr:DUF4229 domain-containing protein [Natronosporangium hydrolyticum]QSB15083.1 DUF4229 domain-containing protein [Natronosporangium hydrolyticum]
MSPLLKYTLGRIGLFAAAFLVLYPIPQLDLLLKLLLALLISFPLSWFLLRGYRDQVSMRLVDKLEQRKEQKEQLRSALAGEDESPPSSDGDQPKR